MNHSLNIFGNNIAIAGGLVVIPCIATCGLSCVASIVKEELNS